MLLARDSKPCSKRESTGCEGQKITSSLTFVLPFRCPRFPPVPHLINEIRLLLAELVLGPGP